MTDSGFDIGSRSASLDASSATKEAKGTKQIQWDATEKKINQIETEYDYPIDTEVRELVVGLNAFDIPTRLSCEGHIDHTGTRGPFVSIGRVHVELVANPDVERKTAESNRAALGRLTSYLTEFYTERTVSPQAQLVLDEASESLGRRLNGGLLHNRGQIDFQQGIIATQKMSPEAAAKKSQTLKAFQTELRDFGGFIKTKFLSS